MTLYAVGDLQGCADAFETLLQTIDFQPARDRLWLVGDLVNRGPASAEVLRAIMALGDGVIAVLGNHDLHLLASAAEIRAPVSQDTFDDVLSAADRETLIDWLRHRPLLHHDRAGARVLVHAGIPPSWNVSEAMTAASEVETLLRDDDWKLSLAHMYGNAPSRWHENLAREDRLRFTINALTRMRFCGPNGELDFDNTGPPGTQPRELTPWFDHPLRTHDGTHIVFGHW
ncbi:MAG: symmetrical bis(5'-nucleosyl)-tetraphosphatase, partial [Gammaproteobacteria bacterium]|nr:symmetrical bis(5'-nucleosyl)-tetraphosphatase [Gammaproteobacteria bacterium]